MPDFESYQSPFGWRYGSDEMRRLWSEAHKRRLWRRIWLALAEAQAELGLVTPEQVDDLRAHVEAVDIARSHAIEAEIKHDLVAEVRAFAEQCPVGGGIIHLGATSADIEDNADAIRLRESLDRISRSLRDLLNGLAGRIEAMADQNAIGFTHLQPAEPTTVGYRLAQYGQDLLADIEELERVRAQVRGKGLKGAVGTSAAYVALAGPEGARRIEERVMRQLGLAAFPVTTQSYPRKQDWRVLNALAGLAASLHKFAFDLRFLQTPTIGEWSEGFASAQVGSSAMPFKRNPIAAEKINSLSRYLAQMPRVAWDNAAHSVLERTLDESASRRAILPEAFLAADELLLTARAIVDGMAIDRRAIARNFDDFAPFAGTEKVLVAAVQAGADRQKIHEVIRAHSMTAWAALADGRENPLADLLASDPELTRFVPGEVIRPMLDASAYVGDAPTRARAMAAEIRGRLRSG